jgi:hypothetical protein
MLVELKIVKIIIILVENLFPFVDDLPPSKREMIRQYTTHTNTHGYGFDSHKSFGRGADTPNVSFFRTVSGSENELSVQEKQEEQNLLKRADLLNNCSELLRLLCLKNQKIQLYVANFLPTLTKNLVLSPMVSGFLEEVIHNNDDLLMEYSKIKKNSKVLGDISPRNSTGSHKNQETKEQGSMGFEFFQDVSNRMQLFSRYSQADILSFLGLLANTDHKSFYMNQNCIFEIIHRPEIFINQLFQFSPQMDTITLVLTFLNDEKERVKAKLESLITDPYKFTEKKFVKEELNLFASLCTNRNSITSVFFRNKFPMDLLVAYISDIQIPDDFKALFFKLLKVLYVDKDPRQPLSYPVRARKFNDDGKSALQDKPYYVDRSHRPKREILGTPNPKDPKNKYMEPGKHSSEDDVLFTKREPSPLKVGELRKELMLIGHLRTQIIDNIEEKSKLMLRADFRPAEFYNEFTLQLLKTLNMMLSFGCYEVEIADQTLDRADPDSNRENMELIERLVTALAYPLEFDTDYHPSLYTTSNFLRFRQNDIDDL